MQDFATITEEQLLHSIVHNRDAGNCRYGFLLGAGASVSSNIPGASEMAKSWLSDLESQAPLEYERITSDKEFDPNNVASFYPQIYQRKFHRFPSDGYQAIEEYMSKKEVQPSIGYSILAQILNRTRHNVVLTTNFDRLTETALLDFEGTHARVVAHEAMLQVLPVHDQKPSIVKIHRDMICSPISTQDGVDQLDQQWSGLVQTLFDRYHFIALGYGGNDGGLMRLIKKALADLTQAQLFWCYRGEPPLHIFDSFSDDVRSKITLVKIHGFDEVMFKLRNRLDFPLYTDQFEKIAEKKKARYKRQLNRIVEAKESADVATAANELLADSWWEVELAAQKASTVEEKEQIYRAGFEKFPESAEIFHAYAVFLLQGKNDTANADNFFQKALKIAPGNASLLGDYAFFLSHTNEHPGRIESFYRKALDVEPDHANNNANYANFLFKVKGNYIMAEKHYRAAVNARPDSANYNGNYAVFLGKIKHDVDAADAFFKKSLKLEPENAITNANYANFLYEVKKDNDDAERYFKKGLEIEPQTAQAYYCYAIFLEDIRKDYEEAEKLYIKALETDPDDGNSLGNYVRFLLADDRIEYSRTYLERAEKISEGVFSDLALELAFYRLALFPEMQKDSKTKIERLLSSGIRAVGWNFERVIESAERNGTADIAELRNYAKWINTAVKNT